MLMGVDRPAPKESREFGWRGWVLVGAIIVGLLIIPVFVTFAPPIGFSYRVSYLVLPIFPAVILAIMAVWATIPER